ncbi:hypothetical protein G7Y89_g11610 [Cudoniella acicularis]|uniref:Uncharacterized protein n=1 Tax=Cudoniella acicularis TaxID=354080 RepID=A0A8H4RCW9_9HELO|nr:hypothetical protein G7Y89_g11610 [Cudoniella acicularis]
MHISGVSARPNQVSLPQRVPVCVPYPCDVTFPHASLTCFPLLRLEQCHWFLLPGPAPARRASYSPAAIQPGQDYRSQIRSYSSHQAIVKQMAREDKPDSADAKFQCSICGDSFKRLEHLSRHRKSHVNDKPYGCPICKKHFTRRDSLNRHISIHNSNTDHRERPVPIARVPRACSNCARLRLRCDGQNPCVRCQTKNVPCIYVHRSRVRIAVAQGASKSADGTASDLTSNRKSPMTVPEQHQVQELPNETEAPVERMDSHHGAVEYSTPDTHAAEGIAANRTANEVDMEGCDSISNADSGECGVSQQHVPDQSTGMLTPPSLTMLPVNHDTNPVPGSSSVGAESMDAQMTAIECPCAIATPSSSMERLSSHQQFSDTGLISSSLAETSDMSISGAFDGTSPWYHELTLIDWMTLETTLDDSSTHYIGDPMSMPLDMQTLDLLEMRSSDGERRHILPNRQFGETAPLDSVHDYTHGTKRHELLGSQYARHDPPANGGSQPGTVHQWPTDWDPGKADNVTSFPDMRSVPKSALEAEDFSHVGRLNGQVYQDMISFVERTSHDQKHFKLFKDSVLPPLEVMNCFMQLYFEYFHPIFPMLHQATFNPSQAPALLVLATTAIGSRYSKAPHSGKCADALQELLRRAIADTCEQDNSLVRQLWLTQAIVLNSIGMMYSGNKRLFELAEASRNSPLTQCRRNGSLRSSADWPFVDENTHGVFLEQKWAQWAHQESWKRLGFCAFLLDAQVCMYLDFNPGMSVAELQQPLPCSDELWDAISAGTWKEAYLQEQAPREPVSTVLTTLSRLRQGQPLPPCTGDFARLVLVFAVYCSAALLQRQFVNPLAPEHSSDNHLEMASNEPAHRVLKYLRPSTGAFSDGLLRSSLNCHIHLAAMLLDVPRADLLDHAHLFRSSQARADSRQKLHDWIVRNSGRDARMALTHAGTLWGMIRYSPLPQPFFSPLMAVLSILVLWTYSHLAANFPDIAGSAMASERQSILRLDKYRSDATTQAWVQGGQSIRGHMTDVGIISNPGASMSILQVGGQALGAMETWALSQGLNAWLAKLKYRAQDSVHV